MKTLNLALLGIGSILQDRIFAFFGNDKEKAYKAIIDNPYVIMRIEGFSFHRADAAARMLKVPIDDERRILALVEHIMMQEIGFGHTYMDFMKFDKILRKYNLETVSTLRKLLYNDIIHIEDISTGAFRERCVFPKKLYIAEQNLSRNVAKRIEHNISGIHNSATELAERQDTLSYLFGDNFSRLDKDQQNAVSNFHNHKLSVITGGPGTGKSTIIKMICDILDAKKLSYVLCAPTGRAAQRLGEATGRKAATIHRLLKYHPYKGWGYNEAVQYKHAKFVIVDESSFLDVDLGWNLFRAVPITSSIVLVGDADQLPPVGPGAIFRDLVKNLRKPPTNVKIFELKTNHRQGLGSNIAETAIRINSGSLQLLGGDDLEFVEVNNPVDLRMKLTSNLKKLLTIYPDFYNDIQVLTPQHTTNIGVAELNRFLRPLLNSKCNPKGTFSVGDKVMQTRNDYTLELFNGFVGKIVGKSAGNYHIEFSLRSDSNNNSKPFVKYPMTLAEANLQLAYASTVHKFQGSECKAGIVIVSSTHTYMLTRNLLYTAITRFKERCIIIGDKIGLRRAITNVRELERHSLFSATVKKFYEEAHAKK